jgi:D-alanine-D-alanine ligase-like ATP-grasp enzyme
MKPEIKPCQDCGPLPVNHFHNWLADFSHFLLEESVGKLVPQKLFFRIDQLIYRIFIGLGFFRRTKEINRSAVSLRTAVFLDEARKRGINYCYLESRFGPVNHFEIRTANQSYFFEGLPRGERLETKLSKIIDDKAKTKSLLQSAKLPTPKGKSFFWFQKNSAIRWAIKNLKFPLVVKPRFGSMCQHVTINIKTIDQLTDAIRKTAVYSPAFIIEEFLDNAAVYRITVVNFSQMACVRRVPAHVVGDGKNTIQDLINVKNQDPRRGNPKAKDFTLFKLVIDEASKKLLKQQGYNLNSVPPKNELVYLQEKIILDLGGDLWEETPKIHPDNRALFQKVAELFNTRLVGIDFLIKDISLSWKSNPCVIIELNSLPYIDMHHFPTEGKSVNVAAAVCELVKKYY